MANLVECKKGNHELKKIFEYDAGDHEPGAVVQWCAICGAVVVDRQFDGRIIPGQERMKMKTPQIFKDS